jgi:hypothetical protein
MKTRSTVFRILVTAVLFATIATHAKAQETPPAPPSPPVVPAAPAPPKPPAPPDFAPPAPSLLASTLPIVPPLPPVPPLPASLTAPKAPAEPQPPSAPQAPSSSQTTPQTFPSLDSIQSQAELDKVIMALSLALFDAYNRCDLEAFRSFLAEDIEFYHDQGGITLGATALTESVHKNICGGDVRRDLVPGTFQANYMKGYGAVELGTHRFVHPKSNNPTGEGKYISLWQYKDGKWKITREISYDHHQAQPDPAKVAPAK